MASLLERAKQVHERLKEKAEIDAIPSEEREKIYKEIDKAVSSNKLRIQKNTFSFTPLKSDVKLPVLINISALLLISGLSVFFFFYFNQAETSIVSEKEEVISAEGKLLQALKEESEQKLGEKEREIANIHSKLEGMRLEQESLLLDSRKQAGILEAELRKSFEDELEAERLKLQNEGLSGESIEEKLREFEAGKQVEFQNQIDLMKEQLEEERLAKEKALNDLISGYEQNLESARTDQLAIEASLKEQYSQKEEQLESERDTAVARLTRFDEQQKQEQLVIDQIFTMYSNINNDIKTSQYTEALQSLDNLENFLNQDIVAELPAILYRRGTDIFMIQSLRKLVEVEKGQNELDTDSLIESANILTTVSGIVEEGNRLYDQGNLEAARESYLTAISRVPALDTGFANLKSIEEKNLEQEREQFARSLSEGDRYFRSKEFGSAIDKYHQALEFLEEDSDVVSKIVSQLVDAGKSIETAKGDTLISSRELALVNEAKVQQQARKELLDELSDLEKNYNFSAVPDTGDSNENLALKPGLIFS